MHTYMYANKYIIALVGMTATIKALKHVAETKHEPSACILIPTLAVLRMYQNNYNVYASIMFYLSSVNFFLIFFFTAAVPTMLKFHFP